MLRIPDWSKWRHYPVLELWEAVALSLEIEPKTVRNSSNYAFAAAGFTVTPEYLKRAEVLERIVESGYAASSGLVLQRQEPAELASTITPADFVRWAKAREWTIPGELADIAEQSQFTAGPTSGVSQDHSGSASGRWPWGTYETHLLGCFPGGQSKFPHPWPGQSPPADGTGQLDDYASILRLASRSAACLSRQLRPSNLSRWPWCMRRSSSGATTTTSPRSAGQSSMGRFEVTMVEAFS